MTEFVWRMIAKFVSEPAVADWIVQHAERTPYTHIYREDDIYMGRWWFFNSYFSRWHQSWLPSVRVHYIRLADVAGDLHDHPWNARTIILRRGYTETRLEGRKLVRIQRERGDTCTLKYGEYHTINRVAAGGAWTLFFTWKYQGPWGFLVKGKKILHKDYKEQR
jgi:hypothetical protein